MTSIKDAIKNFEAAKGEKATESEKVLLYGQLPPIVKMDATLSTLKNCKHLSASSNCIDKIAGLKGMDSLETLSLGRNQLRKLEGLDDVSDTLQELWLSYNLIDKLAGIEKCQKLRVLYMSNNNISKWAEFERLKEVTSLEELLLVGNPLWETHDKAGDWRHQVAGRLPWLKKLDGVPVDDEEKELGKQLVGGG